MLLIAVEGILQYSPCSMITRQGTPGSVFAAGWSANAAVGRLFHGPCPMSRPHHLWLMPSFKSKASTAGAVRHGELFAAADDLLEGFRYRPKLITPAEEDELARQLESLPFQAFDFHGHLANRRVVGFGLRYDYDRREVVEASPIPGFLMPLRQKVAAFARLPADAFVQVLINEYRPGAGIGWHRDKPHFEAVAGVSLLASCTFRLRRKTGARWERKTVIVEPRSAYLMTGAARSEWEHSIPPVAEHRYSITLRTLRPHSNARV
jgi:alkylated DNA repair dioxygenase AlkB